MSNQKPINAIIKRLTWEKKEGIFKIFGFLLIVNLSGNSQFGNRIHFKDNNE